MFTFSMLFKNKKDLNIFFAELKKRLTNDWTIKSIDSNRKNKSFLEYKAYAISIYFVSEFQGNEIIAIGYVELGVFETYIKIMDVGIAELGLNKKLKKLIHLDTSEDIIKNILFLFLNNAIKPLDSMELMINKNIVINYDLNQELKDIRMPRPLFYKEKKSGKIATLNRLELNKIGNRYLNFTPPNNIALLLNVSKRELNISKDLFKNIISKKLNTNKKSHLDETDLPSVYDYLEHIQISIIFAYSAIESFANIAIPFDYKCEEQNGKKEASIVDKDYIEKNFRTSDKLKRLLPDILNIDSPTKLSFWTKFTELERYRHDIIHPKNQNQNSINTHKFLLTQNIFRNIYAVFEIIEYFCNADTKHAFFPIGISNSDINVIEVDDFSDSLKHLDWNYDNTLFENRL